MRHSGMSSHVLPLLRTLHQVYQLIKLSLYPPPLLRRAIDTLNPIMRAGMTPFPIIGETPSKGGDEFQTS